MLLKVEVLDPTLALPNVNDMIIRVYPRDGEQTRSLFIRRDDFMKKTSFRKLRLQEFNAYDNERTLRENIYDLEQENIRIENLVEEMVRLKISIPVILKWMRQMEDNAAEIVYINSLVQLDLESYDFSATSTLFFRGNDKR